MKDKKTAKKFGGRPVEREPEPGKRTHLSLAVPIALKQKIENAASARGWSISNEAAFRLENSFGPDPALTLLRAQKHVAEAERLYKAAIELNLNAIGKGANAEQLRQLADKAAKGKKK